MISAARLGRCDRTRGSAAARSDRRCRRARLGRGMGRQALLPGKDQQSHPKRRITLVGAVIAWLPRPVAERTLTGLSVLLQSHALKTGASTLLSRRSLRQAAGCRAERLEGRIQAFETEGSSEAPPPLQCSPISSIGSKPGSMDAPTLLMSTKAGLRSTTGLSQNTPGVVEDTAQKECLGHLCHAIAVGIEIRPSPPPSSRAARLGYSSPTSGRSSRRSPRSIGGSD